MILVYRAGLLPPHENADFVNEQIRAGHDYRVRLTMIECRRREHVRRIERAAGDVPKMEAALAAAEEAERGAAAALKAARGVARARAETAEQTDVLRKARTARMGIAKDLRAARAFIRTDPAIAAAKAAIDGTGDEERGEKGGAAGQAKREARAQAGVGWGIYSRVEAQADAARKAINAAGGLYNGLQANDPQFPPWRSDGFVGAAQFAGGVTVAELVSGQDTRAAIGPAVLVRQAWDPATRVYRSVLDTRDRDRMIGKRFDLHKTLRLRLGKGPTATWCSWPMRLTRPLPADAVVKEIVVHRKMRADREEWFATITVDVPASARVHAPDGAVGVDLGWRKMPDGGIRVGTWHGTDGQHGEIRLPPVLVEALTKSSGLRAVRDIAFTGRTGETDGGARGALAVWLRAPPCEVPPWLRDAARSLHQWKSQARFAALVRRWADQRFDGDEDAFSAAETWRYRDYHLWRYEDGSRTRSLRRRKMFYRIAAKALAARYRTLVIEDLDLREMAERPEVGSESDVGGNDEARAQRHMVASSELRICLIQAHAEMIKVSAVNTTRKCNPCGVITAFDAARSVKRTPGCPSCGAAWDQDDNAAKNLLDAWRERGSGAPDTGGARKEEKPVENKVVGRSRFERARIAAAERRALLATARKAEDNVAE